MFVYIDKSYMLYVFYIFDLAKIIFLNMNYTYLIYNCFTMYIYVDKSYMLYVFYIFDSTKVIFLHMNYTCFMIVLYMYV